MTVETFLSMLTIVSVFTGLLTEGVKNILNEKKVEYSANLIAIIVSVVLSLFVGISYAVLFEVVITSKVIVSLIALILLSAMSAMVGYDKVMQAIGQIRK